MKTYRYYLFFAGYDGKVEQVGNAASDDLIQWTISPEPTIPIGSVGSWDAVQTSNPTVLYENGRFRMWYQGVDERNTYRIGYAESTDGWQWEKQPQVMFQRADLATINPVPRREGYHHPFVRAQDGHYWLYFTDHRQGLDYIRVAHSSDGYTWELYPEDCLQPKTAYEGRGLHYPWVIYADGQYVMWYTSEDYKHHWYLNRAVSADGIRWQRQPEGQPVIGKETVRQFSRWNYLLPRHLTKWYPNYRHPRVRAAYPDKFKAPQGFLKRLALRFYDQTVFPFRAERYLSFNNGSVERLTDGSYLMLYQSRDENETLSIGLATSVDGVKWGNARPSILYATIQAAGYEWCSVFDADPHLVIMDDL